MTAAMNGHRVDSLPPACRFLFRMLVLLLAGCGAAAAAARGSTTCGQSRDGEALLGALLPMHKGPGCSTVSVRGAQMEAALRSALDRVNRDLRREGISISVRILDTCSQPDEAVKAAMRALVASDQTCLHPPLFLGLIGPEDPESLEAALKVTGVFEAVHVVPWGQRLSAAADGGVLHVAKMNPEERAQGIMLLLRRLRWPTFLLVHGEDAVSKEVSGELLRLAGEAPDMCVQRRVLVLAGDGRGDSDAAWAISKDSSGGVVVLVESVERATALLDRLSSLPRTGPAGEVHVLLAVRQAEAGAGTPAAAVAPARLLNRLKGVAITMLHEVSPAALVPGTQRALLSDSPLWQALASDHQGEPDVMEQAGLQPDSQDASVGALSVGVQLMGTALRAAHRIKCPTPAAVAPPVNGDASGPAPTPPALFCPSLHGMAPDEWRSILERVTAFSDAATTGGRAAAVAAAVPAKMRFGMDLRTAARVLVKRSDAEYFEKAGLLVGGRDLQLDSTRFAFPALRPGVDGDCGGGPSATGAGSSSVSTAASTAPPQRPPSKTKSNRALDRHPRTTPAPKSSSGGDLDWSWILGGSSGDGGWGGGDGNFWQMIYMLAGAGAVMLIVFLCCFWMVYRNFRVKPNRGHDSDSNSSPKSRASRRSSGS